MYLQWQESLFLDFPQRDIFDVSTFTVQYCEFHVNLVFRLNVSLNDINVAISVKHCSSIYKRMSIQLFEKLSLAAEDRIYRLISRSRHLNPFDILFVPYRVSSVVRLKIFTGSGRNPSFCTIFLANDIRCPAYDISLETDTSFPLGSFSFI